MKFLRNILLLAVVVTCFGLTATAERTINIDKAKFTLTVLEDGQPVFEAPVCLGVNYGQKTREGDHKTPEGDFTVWMIQDSSSWTYDYHDGHGKRKGAYGPWFIRLKTPMSDHIGIHGTCFPETVGQRKSEGCIRLRNEDLVKLRKYVFNGMKVHITADPVK